MSQILKILVTIIVNGTAFYFLTQFIPEITYTGGLKFFALVGLLLGIFNSLVKPLIKLLALPFVIFTGGLFLIIINILLLWAIEKIIQLLAIPEITLSIPDYRTYIIGAIALGIVNWGVRIVWK